MSHGARNGLSEAFRIEAATPSIDAYHLAFARERRPGVSWQHLGRMLRVNAEDLRRAFESGLTRTGGASAAAAAEALPAKAQAARPSGPRQRPNQVRGGSLEHIALGAIGDGFGVSGEVAARIGRGIEATRALIYNLLVKGLAVPTGRGRAAVLTPAGVAELARLQGLVDSGKAKR